MKKNALVGVGIAGLGFGESVHLPALESNEDANQIALWHPNSEKLESSCQRNNLIGYKNWNSLLNDEKVDGIIIATPPAPRFELAKEALKAGKHLLLEKPITLNTSQAEELQRLAINNRLSVAVDFEYRAVPLFMTLKKILQEKQIGEIWFVKFDWLMSSRANTARPWDWYSQKEEGGGVIGALGTHAFDILHWLFGPTNTIKSHLSTSIPNRLCPRTNLQKRVTSEDICLAQIGLTETESNKTIPVQLSLSAITRQGRGCWVEIYGSDGTIVIGSNNQKDYVHGFGLWIAEKDGPLKSISADKNFSFNKSWKDGRIAPVARIQSWWIESIRSGKPIIPGLAEGVASQKVSDKIKESHDSGLQVNLS